MPVDEDLALIEGQDPGGGAQGGGFAGAVVADEAVDLAGRDVEREIVHGALSVIILGEMLDL